MKLEIKDKALIVDGEKFTEVYLSKDGRMILITDGKCMTLDFKETR